MRPNKNTLEPGLSELFSGLIWKVKIHRSGIIAIETRNLELKQVLFSALNFLTGEIYFNEQVYQEVWNLSLAFAGEKNLILNAYEHAETPESKGILSVTVNDGSIIWQKFNISLNQALDEGLQVYDTRVQPRKYYWIDQLTAEIKAPPLADPSDPEIIFPETDSSFVFPYFINHGVLAGELLALRYSDKVFISFHEIENDFLKQRLIVYQEDKVLIDDILISGIQKLQPEAFFIQQNHLFYIRNKQEIISYLV